MKSVMLFFIITCLLLCACNDKKDLENTIKSPRNSNKAIEVTQSCLLVQEIRNIICILLLERCKKRNISPN